MAGFSSVWEKSPARSMLSYGSCIRLRAERPNHVWSYDFVEERTHDGRKFRMLNIIDEFTHECLAIRVARRLKSIDVIDVLSDLFILRGVPGHIRSDNVLSRDARALVGQQVSFAGVTPAISIDLPSGFHRRKDRSQP